LNEEVDRTLAFTPGFVQKKETMLAARCFVCWIWYGFLSIAYVYCMRTLTRNSLFKYW